MEKFEKGKVFEPCELVNYVDGGVVSKELIHNTSGSVTLFSFDAGEAFIIPSGARHSVNAAQRFKMVITMIKEKETDKVKFTNQ